MQFGIVRGYINVHESSGKENVLEGRAIAVYVVPFQLQNDHALFCKKK
jgi:hypothetical protein